jgi:biotin-[acetyl-CoA-carboxylase] ligase BirA-like protein
MRVALRRAHRHAGSRGDLLERVAERVLQQHDLRLLLGDAGERRAQVAAKLGVTRVTRRIVCGLQMVAERLVDPCLPPLCSVKAGVDDKPVQPRRELRAATELLEAHADLRERLLRGIACIVGVAEDLPGQPLDLRGMPREQRFERLAVTVLCTLHEDRVAQLLVEQTAVWTELELDRACFSHLASLVRVSELSSDAVLPLLGGSFGRPYRFVESCPSTQRLLAEDDPEGATVVTDHQTEGRGRLGRTWEDVPGRALLLSVLLRPDAPVPLWPELSLVAGEAVAAALRFETGIDASLRHPNDVVVAGRKLVGVLAEASSGRVVLGIGVNVNQTVDELPSDTAKPPTSLRVELGREVERAPLLAAILRELELGYGSWAAPYRR